MFVLATVILTTADCAELRAMNMRYLLLWHGIRSIVAQCENDDSTTCDLARIVLEHAEEQASPNPLAAISSCPAQ